MKGIASLLFVLGIISGILAVIAKALVIMTPPTSDLHWQLFSLSPASYVIAGCLLLLLSANMFLMELSKK